MLRPLGIDITVTVDVFNTMTQAQVDLQNQLEQATDCQYWLDNGVKIFSLQFNFLRPSIYDIKTDESDPSFLSVSQKATHHQTYTKFLQHTKPKNYIFVSYKYTSPFTMTNIYTLDHSCKTGYIRNYDPLKQYNCLLPYNNTSRPLIVPQE